jgi:nucleotidyltransferase substrate binding protein (TIGR01987 family)
MSTQNLQTSKGHTMQEDIRWLQRFQHFERAYKSLRELADYAAYSEVEIDAAIQRFEIAFELAWKTMQDYLEEQGYSEFKEPKKVIAKSFQEGIIPDGECWQKMHDDRNLLSHTYDYETSRLIFRNIISDYLPAMETFYKGLCDERDN